MDFSLMLAVAVFCFCAGIVAAGVFYLILKLIKKQKIKAWRLSVFITGAAVLIASFVFILVWNYNYFSPPRTKVTASAFFNGGQLIFELILFAMGIGFFALPVIMGSAYFLIYTVFSISAFIALNDSYTGSKIISFTINEPSQDVQQLEVCCRTVKPVFILAIPRVWYTIKKIDGQNIEEKKYDNTFFTGIQNLILEKEKILNAQIPSAKYYPAAYNAKISTSLNNAFLLIEESY